MNPNLTMIAQAAAFALFIWFTLKFIWPPLLRAIETRQKQIADGLAEAERGRSSLTEAQKQTLIAVYQAFCHENEGAAVSPALEGVPAISQSAAGPGLEARAPR